MPNVLPTLLTIIFNASTAENLSLEWGKIENLYNQLTSENHQEGVLKLLVMMLEELNS